MRVEHIVAVIVAGAAGGTVHAQSHAQKPEVVRTTLETSRPDLARRGLPILLVREALPAQDGRTSTWDAQELLSMSNASGATSTGGLEEALRCDARGYCEPVVDAVVLRVGLPWFMSGDSARMELKYWAPPTQVYDRVSLVTITSFLARTDSSWVVRSRAFAAN